MANQLGTYKAPALLSYPRILEYNQVPEIKNVFCYVIKKYPTQGLSVVIARRKDNGVPTVSYTLGDWDGKKDKPLSVLAQKFMAEYAEKVLGLMQKISLQHVQLYMAHHNGELILTDVRTHVNKMLGPGATQQLFGTILNVQEQACKPLIINEENQLKIAKKISPFNQGVVLKPSAFKTITRGKELQPMYASIG